MRVAHHKLVRDQIPAIITADGGQPITRVLDDAGYEAALRAKLLDLECQWLVVRAAASEGEIRGKQCRTGA